MPPTACRDCASPTATPGAKWRLLPLSYRSSSTSGLDGDRHSVTDRQRGGDHSTTSAGEHVVHRPDAVDVGPGAGLDDTPAANGVVRNNEPTGTQTLECHAGVVRIAPLVGVDEGHVVRTLQRRQDVDAASPVHLDAITETGSFEPVLGRIGMQRLDLDRVQSTVRR